MVICNKCKPDITPQVLDFGDIEVLYCDHVNILNKKMSDKFKWVSVQHIKGKTKYQLNKKHNLKDLSWENLKEKQGL